MEIVKKVLFRCVRRNKAGTVLTVLGLIIPFASYTAAAEIIVSLCRMPVWEFVNGNPDYPTFQLCVGAGVSVLLLSETAVFVYHTFSVFLREKSGELSILKNTGATKKQLQKAASRVAAFYTVLSAPAGLLIGCLAAKGAFSLLSQETEVISSLMFCGYLQTQFSFSPTALSVVSAAMAVTVVLSARAALKRATKRPSEKVSGFSGRTRSLPGRLGLSRALALRNRRRSKRKNRAAFILFSLSVSLSLISCGCYQLLFALFSLLKDEPLMDPFLRSFRVLSFLLAAQLLLLSAVSLFDDVSAGLTLRRRETEVLRGMGMDERTMRRMLFHEIAFYPFAGFLWGLAESTAVLLPLALSYNHLIHTGYIQIQHLAALLVCLGALAAALLTVTVCAVHFGWKKVRVSEADPVPAASRLS